MRSVRVAHLVSHPIQYFAPLYRELARRREVDLTVFFYSDATAEAFADPGFGRVIRWDTPLLEGYASRFPRSAVGAPLPSGFAGRPRLDLVRETVSGRYDVVWLHGYAHLTAALTAIACRRRGIPVLVRDESGAADRSAAKRAALRLAYAGAAGLAIGTASRRNLESLGFAPVWDAVYSVDNDRFASRARALAPRRAELRAKLGVDDDAPIVLGCAKLVPRKRPLELIDAVRSVGRRCKLLLVGDGPLRRTIEDLRDPDVILAGFLNQSEIADAYVAADILALPSSYEPWGLVVNEALNFGLPVVVSDRVGCAPDLVEDGRSGFVVPDGDIGALASALALLVADADLRASFGARGRTIVQRYGIETTADQIVAASTAAVSRRRAPVPGVVAT